MTWQRIARSLSVVLFVAAALLIGYVAKTELDARAFQAHERRRLEQERAQVRAHEHTRERTEVLQPTRPGTVVAPSEPPALAPGPAALPRVPRARKFKDGEAIGQIKIARLGVAVMVAEGDSPATLRRAVGHLAWTAQPGGVGNVVIAGHRDRFFRPLKDIRAGDAIVLETSDGDFNYVVESTSIVSPTTLSVLKPTGGRTLTLITCYPFFYVGSAPDRFIVKAKARE